MKFDTFRKKKNVSAPIFRINPYLCGLINKEIS